jgi:hypothetical protein
MKIGTHNHRNKNIKYRLRQLDDLKMNRFENLKLKKRVSGLVFILTAKFYILNS